MSGNALAIFIDNINELVGESGSGRRRAVSYNNDPAAAAVLYVEYLVPQNN
ncbi:MAG: hypothetical protein GY820_35315 [Gammaproteobacteria bacterium]|nr:hypothetical protein [Gammaproteobacteria bacterium]